MAVSAKPYGQMIMKALSKEIDWLNDEIKIMLCTSSYVPNQDTHVYLSHITGEVAAGNGYTTGGIVLSGKTMTYNDATNTTILDCNDVAWLTSSITARYAVVYDNTPATAEAKPLLALVDFGENKTSISDEFRIIWNLSGAINSVAAA